MKKESDMHACFQVQIETPKKVLLDGLWFGPKGPQRAIIHTHGLASSAFSSRLVRDLVDSKTAVITFSNRGHDTVTRIAKRDASKKGQTKFVAGMAHEVFTDCVDDIQGVIDFVHARGAKDIYLSGHSTGCQKSVYYLAKKKNPVQVKGLILLAPLSDYADAATRDTDGRLARATNAARALIAAGTPQTLMPSDLWPVPLDAQRFLSLHTPDSTEEIFCYATAGKKPTALMKVTVPTLVLLAEKDEYGDRPMTEIAHWFDTYLRAPHETHIIPDALHNFASHESIVTSITRTWLRDLKRR